MGQGCQAELGVSRPAGTRPQGCAPRPHASKARPKTCDDRKRTPNPQRRPQFADRPLSRARSAQILGQRLPLADVRLGGSRSGASPRSCGLLVPWRLAGVPRIRRRLLFSDAWSPPKDQYGAATAIYGTLVTSLIAMLIAVPVGLGIAVFLTELCWLPLRRPIGVAIELLAGIPSIIYGIWGVYYFRPVMQSYSSRSSSIRSATSPASAFSSRGRRSAMAY